VAIEGHDLLSLPRTGRYGQWSRRILFWTGYFWSDRLVGLGLFWLWMLIDALTNASLDPTMKIVWALVIFFLPFIGALAYLFVGRKGRSTA